MKCSIYGLAKLSHSSYGLLTLQVMLITKKDHCIKEMGVRIPEYEAEETRGAQERGGRTSTKLIV